MIKNIKLFVNNNDEAMKNSLVIEKSFIKNGFSIVDKNFDLGIAVGGDGSFLRMVKSTNFDENIKYVGVNSGHLGFLQDITMETLNDFIKELIENKYKVDDINIQETNLYTKNSNHKYLSLNEIIIRDIQGKVVNLEVKINDDLLEVYKGDGLMILTTCGSTAHNLSYGGSIVFNTLPTLQITSMAPINSKAYRSLINSVIVPKNYKIDIIPTSDVNNYGIIVDGEYKCYENIEKITTELNDRKIKCLRLSNYKYAKKIQDKLLS